MVSSARQATMVSTVHLVRPVLLVPLALPACREHKDRRVCRGRKVLLVLTVLTVPTPSVLATSSLVTRRIRASRSTYRLEPR